MTKPRLDWVAVLFLSSASASAQLRPNPNAPNGGTPAVGSTSSSSLALAGYTDRSAWAAAAGGPTTLVDFDSLADGALITSTGALLPWGIADTFGSSLVVAGPVEQFAYCSCSMGFPMFVAGTLPSEPNYLANERLSPNWACGTLTFEFANLTTACGAFVADQSPVANFTVEVFDASGASMGTINVPPRTLPDSFVGVVSTLPFASAEFRSDSPYDSWGLDDFELSSHPPVPTPYCTAGTTTHGCVPSIASTGSASASAGSGFTITVGNVEGAQFGLVFYGLSGQVVYPWGTSASFMCVKPPLERTPVQQSGGTFGACDGAYALDWNLYIASNPLALGSPFVGGESVCAQAWFRDPPSPKSTNLSNGLKFDVNP